MLEAVAHVGVGLQVEHPVAALEGALEQRLVEDVALVQGHARIGQQVLDELPATGAEVIDDHHLDARRRAGGRRACEPMNPAPPVTQPGSCRLQSEAGGDRVAVEHLHGLERVLHRGPYRAGRAS